MDDATFAAIMRRCLHGLAALTEDETARRHLLGMAAAFEARFGTVAATEPERIAPRWLDGEARAGDAA